MCLLPYKTCTPVDFKLKREFLSFENRISILYSISTSEFCIKFLKIIFFIYVCDVKILNMLQVEIVIQWNLYKADTSIRRTVWRGTVCFALRSNYLKKILCKAAISIKRTLFLHQWCPMAFFIYTAWYAAYFFKKIEGQFFKKWLK